MDDWRSILQREFGGEGFDGEPITFLMDWRTGKGWDKEAYERLFVAMRECCKAHDGKDTIERWIVDGFYYLSCIVAREEGVSAAIPHNAAVNFDHLAFWLFTGQSREDDEFEPV